MKVKEDISAVMPQETTDEARSLREISELVRLDMLRYDRRLDAEEESDEL